AEREKATGGLRRATQQSGGTVPTAPGGGANAANGNGQTNGGSRLGGNGGTGGQGGFAGGGGGRGFFFRSGAAQKWLPAPVRNFSRPGVTPEETIQQLGDPPPTELQSAGEPIRGGGAGATRARGRPPAARRGSGVVRPSLVSKGRSLSKAGGNEALLAASYASREKLGVGSTLELNGTKFAVVGLVRPPLGGQGADVYIPVAGLQKLSSQTGLANVVLVRAKDGDSVAAVQKAIETKYPNAQVASQKQVTDQISGSLVDASNLAHRLGVALAILAALAAFLLAALLTLSSVGKRVREIGTLKAMGWTQRLVLRQIVGESTAQGILGGLLGVVLGVAAATAIGA